MKSVHKYPSAGELRHQASLPRGGGDIRSCHTLFKVHTVCINNNSNIPLRMTLWFPISQRVRINSFIGQGGIPLWAATNWSCTSLLSQAIHYAISLLPFASIWIKWHSIACCFRFCLHLALCTSWKCMTMIIVLVPPLAAFQWTDWYLQSCGVSGGGVLDNEPIGWHNSDLLSPSWRIAGAIICGCGQGEENDNGQKWEVLRNI